MMKLGSITVPVMRRAGLLLVLAAATVMPAHLEAAGRVCGGISVSSPDRPRVRGRFSVAKTLDLLFRMRLRNVGKEPHVVSFRIFTPKGHLYQEIQVGYRAESGKRVSSISAGLPVAGTAIATSSLYGRWRVVPYLDGGTRPCGAASAFKIIK
jgi:hypothetical protein